MSEFILADKMHRLMKEVLDSGAVHSIADAEALFAGYRLAIMIDDKDVNTSAHQIALLTAVALGRRVFHGGITVTDNINVPLVVPLPFGNTLHDAVIALGGKVDRISVGVPIISIGGEPCLRKSPFHIRTEFSGWRGGIVPADSDISIDLLRK